MTTSAEILVAGDVPLLRSLLRMALEDAGFERLAEVTSPEELLAYCASTPPRLIVLDLDIPEVESVRLIEDILDVVPMTGIIAVSDMIGGYSEKALSAGAIGFLQKPFSIYDLVDMLRKVMPQR
jgi:DNA-binding NarL/FixJ family response regulator